MSKRSVSSARGMRVAKKERPTAVAEEIDVFDIPEASSKQLRAMR